MSEHSEQEVFKVEHRGFICTAFYDADHKAQNAHIVVTRDGIPYKEFEYPAYRVWNIAAHWADTVENELSYQGAEIDERTGKT